VSELLGLLLTGRRRHGVRDVLVVLANVAQLLSPQGVLLGVVHPLLLLLHL